MFAGFLMPSNLRRILGVLLTVLQASDAVEVRLPLYASLIDLLSLCLPGKPPHIRCREFLDSHVLMPGLTSRPEGFVDFHPAQHASRTGSPSQAMPKSLQTSCRKSHFSEVKVEGLALH